MAAVAIRLRRVDGKLLALCAARTKTELGDHYLDDEEHRALAEKFWRDYPELNIVDKEAFAAIEAAEGPHYSELSDAGKESTPEPQPHPSQPKNGSHPS